jgi:hypothetical protein
MGRAACPAVRTLRTALEASIPLLTQNYKEWAKDKQGKDTFQPRLQTGGNPRHESGLCLDIILFCGTQWTNDPAARANWANEKKLGENLVQTFLDLRDDMQWTEVIFQDRLFWEPDLRYTAYGQDQKHFTHIHIDWANNALKGQKETIEGLVAGSPRAAADGFGTALTPRLRTLNTQFEAGSLREIALGTITPKPHPPADATGRWEVRAGHWAWHYTFAADGTVSWRDPLNGLTGSGRWRETAAGLAFDWAPSKSTETWALPLSPAGQAGAKVIEGKRYDVRAVRLDPPPRGPAGR